MVTIRGPRDPNTLSNYHNWRTRHTILDLTIDFARERLVGSVTLQVESTTDHESKELLLDTSYVDVHSVHCDGEPCTGWKVKDRFEPYGSALAIPVPSGKPMGASMAVTMAISTTPKSTALQWLTPKQTSNQKHPYLFNQSEAIHARSIFPCQDTPDVKSTYETRVRSTLPVITSGLPRGTVEAPKQQHSDGLGRLIYLSEQKIPIPSYLFAIAAGDIASAMVGERSVVATGPEELAETKRELDGEVEKFLKVAEELLFPYEWVQYNLLVLPGSFPYGGMENPVYTFATPTIISGDKQNLFVVAHEIGHAWAGNLVSNASWEHLWLNEGWATYIERRIDGALHGQASQDFNSILGWDTMVIAVNEYGKDHEFTKLVVDLKGKDPDDSMSTIPYEKGYTFLCFLEKTVGREAFDKFIPFYFQKWKYHSLDSYEFKATLLDYFAANDSKASKALEAIDWDWWYYTPGLPPKPDFDTTLASQCSVLANKWADPSFNPSPSDITHLSTAQLVVFLQILLRRPLGSFSAARVHLMGTTYSLSTSTNAEVSTRFCSLALQSGDGSVVPETLRLLRSMGRIKFVRTLYENLAVYDEQLSRKTYAMNRQFYHPICRMLVEKDFEAGGKRKVK